VERQINVMARRGPDGRHVYCHGPLGLGHALMRVTEEDSYGVQPLVDHAAGIALAADLRLDNRDELAQWLAIDEASLARLSDSALLLRAYKAWGEACVDRLLGDFAFAIWDGRAEKLLLGRDHMGARYVHYHRSANVFVFATEKKALWAVDGVPRRLHDHEIGRILIRDTGERSGETSFAEIRGLLPATVLTIALDGAESSRRYWQPHADPRHVGRDEAYYVETYRAVLKEAVSCRLRRNVRPSGMLLSGGFDSAAVAAFSADAMAAQKRKLLAAASVMPAVRDDVVNARKWVEACERHMPHLDVRYVTREGHDLLDGLDDYFMRVDDHPSFDYVANAATLASLADAGARVLMDGMGGDYTLNSRARGWLAEQLAGGHLWRFVSELLAYRRNRDSSFWTVIKQEVIKRLLPPEFVRRLRSRKGAVETGSRAPVSRELLDRAMALGLRPRYAAPQAHRGYYARQLAVLLMEQDKAGNGPHMRAAQYGLEYVQPFHDKRVVEFGLAIPSALQVRGGRNRYLARRALGALYPPELLVRPDGNDLRTPDIVEMAGRQQPQLFAEIARLERNDHLGRYVDFAKMRTMLTGALSDPAAPDSGWRVRASLRTLYMARFIAWVERDNRSGSAMPDGMSG
jgi:asparagine synthase (glutamine-hydrolysing)